MTCLATFKTTSMALMFERVCRSSEIKARIAPVPRKLSSSCGLACEFPCEERERIEQLISIKKIEVGGWHDVTEDMY